MELPHFTVRPPPQLEVSTIQNITVRCQANGEPQPKITWMKENGALPVGRSLASEDGTLKIWNPKEEDSEKYTCGAASNEFFKAFTATKLTIKRQGKKDVRRYEWA